MDKKEISEGNQMIAEFMGAKGKIIFTSTRIFVFPNGKMVKCINLRYHKSWDWLMPVIEKIGTVYFNDGMEVNVRTFGIRNSETGDFMVRFDRFALYQSNQFIDATWNAVIGVIKWYNEVNKNK